jgi:spermidine/putrescine transport system permease protein
VIPRRRLPWVAIVSVGLMIFLYAPLAVSVLYAFNGGSNLTWPPQGLSLRWFLLVAQDSMFRNAFWVSVEVATVASLVATVLGTAAAVAFTRSRSRWSRLVEALGRLPIMLPPLFIGIGFVALMNVTGIGPSFGMIVLGHIVYVVPWVIVILSARLLTFEVELEEAGRDLGAGPFETMRRVTLPILAPAIVGAILLTFAWSFDELLITNFTSGVTSTVPIYVMGRLRRVADPGANAVATVLLLIPWGAFAAGALILRRNGGSIAEILGQRVK